MAQVDMPKSSIGQTPTEPKKKLEKVVKGKVAVKEQSDMQKIASQFLAEDLKTVKDRILTDYLLPMLKNGAWSILNSAFSIALWGEDRSRGGSNNYYGNNRGQRNSYDGYYQGSQNNRPNPPPVRRSLQNLDFESRGDAEDTLAGLRDALYRYRQVSVGDLWDLMGVTNDSTDYNYGWYNLDDAFIKGIPEMKIARPDHQPVNVKCLECGDVRGILKQSWDNGLAGLTEHDKLLTCPICGVLTSHILVEKVGKSDE